jgi:hypothetical protein
MLVVVRPNVTQKHHVAGPECPTDSTPVVRSIHDHTGINAIVVMNAMGAAINAHATKMRSQRNTERSCM